MRENQFQITKNNFLAATSFLSYPLTYEAWMGVDDSLKAAALYVNFYPQVILAWQKETAFYLDEEDLVSIALQYIIKNVDIIKADKKRFTSRYMYRVLQNAIIGFRRPEKRREHVENTQSNIVELEDGEHDLFEVLEDGHDCFREARFKSIIESMDDSMKAYVSHLIWGTQIKAKDRRNSDAMLERLKDLFSDFTDTITDTITDTDDITGGDNELTKVDTTFGDIYSIDDAVKSAVCIMSDGEQAVYYGEKQIMHDTKTVSVVFFGAKKDYIVPLDIAKKLVVTDLECY